MLADPEVAVMVALPSAMAVTSPADETVATDELDVAQVTVAPEIGLLLASFTVAVNEAVSSTEVRVRLVGDRVTLAAA